MKTKKSKVLSLLVLAALLMSVFAPLAGASAEAVLSTIPTEPVKAANFGIYKNTDIPMRDTYAFSYNGRYYLYGTEGTSAFTFGESRFEGYASDDMENWEGPYMRLSEWSVACCP